MPVTCRRTVAITLLAAGCLAAPVAAQPARTQAPPPPFTRGITDADSLKGAVNARLARARQLLAEMLGVTAARTVANTLRPYDELSGELYTAASQARVFAALHPDAAMRGAADDLNRAVSAFAAEIPLRADVYAALRAIDLTGVDASTRYYIQRELKEFTLAGVDKPEATRQQIQKLRDELTTLEATFARNIQEQPRRISVQPAELEGLPADFIARHKPEADGSITLTTDAVDQRPVMTYARGADVRRRMLMAAYNVAAPDNLAVLDGILRARWELASLLGYPNWAAVDAASRMSGDVGAVTSFIDRIVEASGPGAARDIDELTRRKQQELPGSRLELWDRAYYSELVRRASYDFDSQSVRPYLPFDRVLPGILATTGRMFGIRFRPVADAPVWHPSVTVYEVAAGDRLLGRLYLDLHPRAGKRSGGASVTTVGYGSRGGGIPEAVLAAGVPGGVPGDPGLMAPEDVRTLFHELGHVVHRLAGGHQPWQKLSSLALERDFTEAPSQMLEEWMWDPGTLATFARHHQTGEPIPAALVRQMRRAADFGQALEVRAQMVLARVALAYHDRDPRTVDGAALWKEIHNRYVGIPFVEGAARQASFPHIGQTGYASAYYTYMWSLVIAKDLFSRFDGQTLDADGVAVRFREVVFEPGSSRPAADLVRDFMGRPFNFDAWERWLNGRAVQAAP